MIPYFNVIPKDEERELLLRAFDSGWWSGGEYVKQFESKLSEIFSTKVLSVSNGTAALMLAYMALSLGPGDSIIVPAFSFMAASNVAKRMEIKPVFVDVREDTWNIDESKILESVTPETRAIVAVHNYGVMCDISKILSISKNRGLALIEDCAEAFDSRLDGKPAGTFGDIGTFSFQATKTITTGEGGAVVTDKDYFYDFMGLVREHGLMQRGSYDHKEFGLNFRLPNLLAALGVAQIEDYKDKISRRNEIATYYSQNIHAPHQRYPEGTSIWVYAFRSRNQKKLITDLLEAGIESRPGFKSPNLCYAYSWELIYNNEPHRNTPIADMLSREVISLPTYPELKDSEVEYICQTVNKLL